MLKWLLDITPLRVSPPFRRLWVGGTLSAVGSSLSAFAVTLQVYDLTRSPFAVGLIGLAQLIPLLLVGAAGGPLLDNTNRRRLMLITSSVLAAVSAGFAVQAYTAPRLLWLLYLLAAVQAGVFALNRPLGSTFVPSLLGADQIPAGLALNNISTSVMLIVGPVLAGAIAATPHLGLRTCYLVDALTFTAALYSIARLPSGRNADLGQDGAKQRGLRAVAEGYAFIRHSQVLSGAFLTDLTITVFGFPTVLLPAINAERFGGNPRTLGYFMAAFGLGTLIAMAFSGPLKHVARPGRAMSVTVAVTGAAFVGFALAHGLAPRLATLAVAGAADSVTVVFRGTLVATVTPDQFRGRVMATDAMVTSGGGQIGRLESGALGSLTTPVIAALTGGLVAIAAAVGVGLALPAFTRYRSGGSSG